jgi:DMSO/TMAO reductase YedYZ molybdopterin-dependent catalytic subunit
MKTTEFKEIEVSEKEFKKINRRSFLTFIGAAIAGVTGLYAIGTSSDERGMPRALRVANTKIGNFWNGFFSQNAKSPPVNADGVPVRINGDVGMLEEINLADYRLSVKDPKNHIDLNLTLDQIKSFPSTSESFEFKCIEGWSRPVSCKGVRFSDLMEHLNAGKDSKFAGMTSINEEYYVSWDSKSLMHPQTLLCYEMNGVPLQADNGAPLRILSSVKYGVKQIKQVAQIEFTDVLPADYWAEQGYDDYLGL